MRTRMLLAPLLCAVLLLVVALPGSAHAWKTTCTKRDDGAKVCKTVKPQQCKSGNPTVCQRWRNRCTIGKRGWYRCVFTEKYARCNGYGGRRCRTTYTTCDTTKRSKACRSTAMTTCSKSRGWRTCAWTRNDCRSRGSFWRCTFSQRWTACRAKDGYCEKVRKTCRSGSGRSSSCTSFVVRQPGSGGAKPGTGGGSKPGSGGSGGSGSGGSGSDDDADPVEDDGSGTGGADPNDTGGSEDGSPSCVTQSNGTTICNLRRSELSGEDTRRAEDLVRKR